MTNKARGSFIKHPPRWAKRRYCEFWTIYWDFPIFRDVLHNLPLLHN